MHGWKGNIAAILLMVLLTLASRLFQLSLSFSDPVQAVISALDRMFVNPASTIENLFYFGFLTERL